MKALTLNGYEGLASLKFVETPMPEPAPQDVVVEVRAASVNPVDGKITRGYGDMNRRLPHVLGRDCAGVVARIGSGVATFKAGDEVYGVADAARWGTHAQYVSLPAATLALKPQSLSDVDAGSLPIAGLSAYAGLVATGGLQAGQRVLIHAGAGGIGSFAVQLAKSLGAEVAATAGAANLDFVKSLGADRVIDYTRTDFSSAIEDCDMVFDLVGGDVRFRSFPVLKPGGVLVHISVPPMAQPPPRDDVTIKQAPVKYDTALIDKITAMVHAKAVRPTVSKVFAFADALKAFQHVMTGHARGKVMLDLTSESRHGTLPR